MKKLLYFMPVLIFSLIMMGAKNPEDSFDLFNIGLVVSDTGSLNATYETPIKTHLEDAGHTVTLIDDAYLDSTTYNGTGLWTAFDCAVLPYFVTTPSVDTTGGIGDIPIIVLDNSLYNPLGFCNDNTEIYFFDDDLYRIRKLSFDETINDSTCLSSIPINGFYDVNIDSFYFSNTLSYSFSRIKYGEDYTSTDYTPLDEFTGVKGLALFDEDTLLAGSTGYDYVYKFKWQEVPCDSIYLDTPSDIDTDGDTVFAVSSSTKRLYKGTFSSGWVDSLIFSNVLQRIQLVDNYIYGSDYTGDKIYKINKLDLSLSDSITLKINNPYGIWFDKIDNYIYWSGINTGSRDIRRAKFNSIGGSDIDSAFTSGEIAGDAIDLFGFNKLVIDNKTTGYISSNNDSIVSIFDTGEKTFYSSTSNYTYIKDKTNSVVTNISGGEGTVFLDTLNNQKRICFGYYDVSKLTDTIEGGWTLFDRCIGRLLEAEQDSIFKIGVVSEIPSALDSNLIALKTFLNTNMHRASFIDTIYHDSTSYDGTNSWSSLNFSILYSNSLNIGKTDTMKTDSIMLQHDIIGLDPYNMLKFNIGEIDTVTTDQDSLKITKKIKTLTDGFSVSSIYDIYSSSETEDFYKLTSTDTLSLSVANSDTGTSSYDGEGALSFNLEKRYISFPWRIINNWSSNAWDLFINTIFWTLEGQMPPSNINISSHSTDSLYTSWKDNSNDEDNFIITLLDGGNYSSDSLIIGTTDLSNDTVGFFWPPNTEYYLNVGYVKGTDTTYSYDGGDSLYTLASVPLSPITSKSTDSTIYFYLNNYNLIDRFTSTALDTNPVWDEIIGDWNVESPYFRLRTNTDGGWNTIRTSYGPEIVEGFSQTDFADSSKWSKTGGGGVSWIFAGDNASLTGDSNWHAFYQSPANRADLLEPSTYYYLDYTVVSNSLVGTYTFQSEGGTGASTVGLVQNYNLTKTVGSNRTLVKTRAEIETKNITFNISAGATSGTIVLDDVSIKRAGKENDLYKDVNYSMQFHFNDSLRLNSQWIEFHPFMVDTNNTYYAFFDSSNALFIKDVAGTPDTLIDTTYTGNYKWRKVEIERDFEGSPADTTVTWRMILDLDTLGTALDETFMTQSFLAIRASDRRMWFDNILVNGLTPVANSSFTHYAIQDSVSGEYIQLVSDDFDTLGTAEDWNTYSEWGGSLGSELKTTNPDSVSLRVKARNGE